MSEGRTSQIIAPIYQEENRGPLSIGHLCGNFGTTWSTGYRLGMQLKEKMHSK